MRYAPAVSVFSSVGPDEAWDDIAALAGPGGAVVLAGGPALPAGWSSTLELPGFQMVAETFRAEEDAEAVVLGDEHVPAMTALVELTRPGPWAPRTIDLGGYRGILRDGELVAMAGERMHAGAFTEISAVCTHPSVRGQGLATRLMRAVAAGIEERGETPFLHVAGVNTGAIRLYESLGFSVRRPITFTGATAPV